MRNSNTKKQNVETTGVEIEYCKPNHRSEKPGYFRTKQFNKPSLKKAHLMREDKK